MSWLKRFTGGGTTVAERLAKLNARGDWAAMLSLARGEELDEVSRRLVDEAGNRLAAINLEQAEACLRVRDYARAREHLDLAGDQARSEELQQRRGELFAALGGAGESQPAVAAPHDCSSCGSVPAAVGSISHGEDDGLPEEVAWELFLETLSPDLAMRYAGQPTGFCRGVLASRQGQFDAALAQLQEEPGEDDLQAYELALLHFRREDPERGLPLLGQLLEQHPELEPALELAVDLALQGGWPTDLRPLLQARLAKGLHVGICHAALARIELGEGNGEALLAHGRQALEHGAADAGLVAAMAGLLEQRGDQTGAEQLLRLLPAGGCHGGAHPLLGEFWLRQGQCLDQALECFKAASRQEPANRRWPLRIGQAYLQLGWRKEGERLLNRLLDDPDLDLAWREEIFRTLSGVSGG